MGADTDESETVGLPREVRRCPECGQRFGPDARFCPFDGGPLLAAPWDASKDPLLGKLIDGRYRVEALLGEGGMGRVYQVRHAALDRLFAMKVLKRELATDNELSTRFVREARAAASIRHPHVVAITDFGEIDASQFASATGSFHDAEATPYFVMEFLNGQSLAQLLRRGGPVPAGRAARILAQIAEAVGAAHDAGIVHRDLKPDNIFLVGRADGRDGDDVRVLDFGAAQVMGNSRLTKKGVVFGTPHYMSPEQAQGHAVDYRSDVYALGVIMYEMFTGRVPFEGDSYMGVLTQHMFADPPALSTLSGTRDLGALEAITMRCLAKAPDHRYLSTRALAEDVARAVSVASDGQVMIARSMLALPPKKTPGAMGTLADEVEPPSRRRTGSQGVAIPTKRMGPLALAVALGVLAVGVFTLVWVRTKHGQANAAAAAIATATSAPATAPSTTAGAHVDAPPAAPPIATMSTMPDAVPARGQAPLAPPSLVNRAAANPSLPAALAPARAALRPSIAPIAPIAPPAPSAAASAEAPRTTPPQATERDLGDPWAPKPP